MHEYTFKDTGVAVHIRKVSPLLLLRLREDFPPPRPPMQEVDYGDGKKKMEPNPAHPDYQEAQDTYNVEMEKRLRRLLIRRGVKLDWTPEMKAEVVEVRELYLSETGREMEEDDHVVFVSYVAVGTDKDLEELLEVIMRRSAPTEAAAAEAQERFKSPV